MVATRRRLTGAPPSPCRTGLVIAGPPANLPRIGGEEGQMSTYQNWVPNWLDRIACRMVGKRSAALKAVQQPADLDPARIEEKSEPLRDSSADINDLDTRGHA